MNKKKKKNRDYDIYNVEERLYESLNDGEERKADRHFVPALGHFGSVTL